MSNTKTLDTISKVLANAEDQTLTEEERELFFQKAAKLASAIGIDLAIARAHKIKKEKREEPEKRSFKVGSYGAKNNGYMVELFTRIAEPHDVSCMIGHGNVWVFGYGFPSDLDIVNALYGVAVIHMVNSATEALKRGVHKDASGLSTVDGRIWRAEFYEGFIARLSSRLWQAHHEAKKAVEGTDSTGVELVLRDKRQEVKEFLDKENEHRRHIGSWSPPDRNSWVDEARQAGRHSATNLNLNPDDGLGRQKEIAG